MKALLISLLLICGARNSFGQVGVKIFYELNRFNGFVDRLDLSTLNGRMMGLGLDVYTSERSFLGFDFAFDLAAMSNSGFGISSIVSRYEYASNGFTLRSNFVFTGDADYTHGYCAVTTGLRSFKESGQYETSSNDFDTFEGSKLAVPIGLRAGFRGTVDGQFMDFWFGFNSLLNGVGFINEQEVAGFYSELNRTTLVMGVAYGISWY